MDKVATWWDIRSEFDSTLGDSMTSNFGARDIFGEGAIVGPKDHDSSFDDD